MNRLVKTIAIAFVLALSSLLPLPTAYADQVAKGGLRGPAGPVGPPGPQGPAGANGANGISVVSATLPVGDANCPNGGASFTSSKRNNVCL